MDQFYNPNPYFEQQTLTKEFHYGPDGSLTVKATQIKWKKDLTRRAAGTKGAKREHEDEEASFYTWFSDDNEDQEFADLLKDDIWADPIKALQVCRRARSLLRPRARFILSGCLRCCCWRWIQAEEDDEEGDEEEDLLEEEDDDLE